MARVRTDSCDQVILTWSELLEAFGQADVLVL